MSNCRWLLSAAAAVGFAISGANAYAADKVVNIWHTEPNAKTKARRSTTASRTRSESI